VTQWQQSLRYTQRFLAGRGGAYSEFGSAVAIDGTTALVGGLGPDASFDQKTVYVYERIDGQWKFNQTLTTGG